MAEQCDNDSVFQIKKQFFNTVALTKINFKEIVELCKDNTDLQKCLLDNTILNDLNIKYPIRLSYQKQFLKTLLSILEENFVEIHDELYNAYCQLLKESCNSSFYNHFHVNDSVFTIEESASIISEGTTGLYTWPASKALAEYLLTNQYIVNGKTVLELGCGAGFLGLSVCFTCAPSCYVFTDCHDKVLELVSKNIKLNSKKNEIKVLKLDWNEPNETVIKNFDVILAADIVYDKSLFKSLIEILKKFFNLNNKVRIIVACAVRDRETYAEFLKVLHSFGSVVKYLKVPEPFNYDFPIDTEIKIADITFL